jgi:DNA polymerase-1
MIARMTVFVKRCAHGLQQTRFGVQCTAANVAHLRTMPKKDTIFWKAGSMPGLARDTYIVTSSALVQGCLARYAKKRVLGLDTETTTLDPLLPNARIRLLQLADERDVTIFDLFKLGKQAKGWIWKFLEDPARVKVVQNAKFDLQFMITEYDFGELQPLFDTMIAGQLLDLGSEYEDRDDESGKKRRVEHNIQRLLLTYLNLKINKDVEHSWAGELTEHQLVYASNDGAHLVDLRAAMVKLILERGIARKAKQEFDAVQPTAQRELNGILMDREKWMGIYRENKKKLTEVEQKLEKQIKPMAGDNMQLFAGGPVSFNMNSTEQVKERLRAMGIKLPQILDKETKTSRDTLSMDKLAQISSKDPVLSTLITRAKLSKAVTSYGKGFLRWLSPIDGRVHPDIRQIGTPTCREAAKQPPVHGIPKSSDHRECFIAPPGWMLVWADYSQIELRILAEFSGDKNMLKAFRENLDLHKQSASLIFGVEYEAVVDIQRRRAKDINFGKPYGVGPERFAERAGISLAAAEKMMGDHDRQYPQSNAYLNSAASHARIYGWVRTMSGALITFNFNKNNKREVGAIGRYGRNYPIQGTSADITKTAEKYVYDGTRTVREPDGTWPVKLIHVVHDEIVLEVREDHVEFASDMLHSSMVRAGEEYLKTVPVVVDVSVNNYWKKREDE